MVRRTAPAVVPKHGAVLLARPAMADQEVGCWLCHSGRSSLHAAGRFRCRHGTVFPDDRGGVFCSSRRQASTFIAQSGTCSVEVQTTVLSLFTFSVAHVEDECIYIRITPLTVGV